MGTIAIDHTSQGFLAGERSGEADGKGLETSVEQTLAKAIILLSWTTFQAVQFGTNEEVGILCFGIIRAHEEAGRDAGGRVGRAVGGTVGDISAMFMGDHGGWRSAEVGSSCRQPGTALPSVRTTGIGAARISAEST